MVSPETTYKKPLKFTSVRELKAKTSEMLRTVERGNTVLVTTHGRPTAMLVPVTEDDIDDALLCARKRCLTPCFRLRSTQTHGRKGGVKNLALPGGASKGDFS